jgi:hypothetical protein
MTSPETIRDPVADHLLTPQNAAVSIISRFNSLRSVPVLSVRVVANIVALAKIAELYELPVVLASVNVKPGITSRPSIS